MTLQRITAVLAKALACQSEVVPVKEDSCMGTES